MATNPAGDRFSRVPAGQGAAVPDVPLPPVPEALAKWLYFPITVPRQPMPQVPPLSGMPGSGLPGPDLPSPAAKGIDKKEQETKSKEEEGPDPTDTSLIHGFNDTVIRNLNARLEDPDWGNRVKAANDLVQILQVSPAIATHPQYKPYLDAFMLKILRDPFSTVHEPVYLAIQSGMYTNPSPPVMQEMQRLSVGTGLLGLEPQQVNDALFALRLHQAKKAKEGQPQNNIVPFASPGAPVNPVPSTQGRKPLFWWQRTSMNPNRNYSPGVPLTGPLVPGDGGLQHLTTPPLAGSAPLNNGLVSMLRDRLRPSRPMATNQAQDGQRLNVVSSPT